MIMFTIEALVRDLWNVITVSLRQTIIPDICSGASTACTASSPGA